MRRLVFCFLLAITALPAAGQQILLNFGSLGSYFSATAPNLTEGPILLGNAGTSPSGTAVNLTSGTSFLWFSNGSDCQTNLSKTFTVDPINNPQGYVYACLVNLTNWGTYYGLITATAFGFPSKSVALDVTVAPTGNVSAAPSPVDVSSGETTVIITNNLPNTALTRVVPFSFSPDNSSWLNVVENVPCSGIENGGSCTVTVSANPTATGLEPGTYAAQIAYDAGGNRAAIAVTYTYNPMPLRFVPATSCRVADTRNVSGPILSGNSSRSFQVSGVCNVPPNAQAYSLNVTAVPKSTLGFLALWPSGQPRPTVSTLNSDGRVKANAAIVPAGTGGAVSVYASDDTHVILDIDGYFIPASDPSALAFYPLNPCRVADTRGPAGGLGGPILSGDSTRTFTIAGICGVPASAQAYSLNFTAVPTGSIGYLTAWQAGAPKPVASTLNAPYRAVTANAAIIPASSQGAVSVYASDQTHVIIDINGYFAPAGANNPLSLYNLTPCRVEDTRVSKPFTGLLAVNFLASPCAVPSTALAYIANATVVPLGALGYLSLWPQGQAKPVVSTLNSDGSVTSNMAIVPTLNGSLNSYASDTTQLILDISGYFAP